MPGAFADPGRGPHRKITRYMGRSRSKPHHTPDEISCFRAWGGGGVAIYFSGMHLNRLPNGGPGSG